MRNGWLVMFLVGVGVGCSHANDGQTLFEAAQTHLRGGDDTFSMEQAAAGFAAACKQGHQVACTSLGLQLQDGRGVPRDLPRAISLYEKACDAGAGIGCMNRAFMFEGGQGDDDDPVRAAAFFTRAEQALQKSCDAGDLQWCTNLGVLYEQGFVGGKPDPERAAAVYKKACDRQIGDWCTNLALLQLYGRLSPPDIPGAMALLEKVCATKSPLACSALGKMLVMPPDGATKDVTRGLALLEGACHDGEVHACGVVGAVYDLGEDVPPDPVRSTAAQTRACLLGESSGCVVIALARAHAGTHADAVPWLERGCNIGSPDPCAMLATMVDTGDGVTADPARALTLYNDACRLGDRSSCVEIMKRKQPLPLSPEHKLQFLKDACEHGFTEACSTP